MPYRLLALIVLLALLSVSTAQAGCVWVLWKEVVEGKEILGAAQPWFLVKTFSDRDTCVQHLKTSVEELKNKMKELSVSLPPHVVEAFVDEEQGSVLRMLVNNPTDRQSVSTRFLCLPDTLDPHKVVHP